MIAGPSLVIENIKITPQSKLIRAERPSCQIIWHHPTGVLVEEENQTKVVPIWDVTRLLQVGLLTLSLIFQLLGMITQRKKSHETSKQ
ncbi:MAG: hypothetical protein R3D55_09820 [Chloroflexota bacterium]